MNPVEISLGAKAGLCVCKTMPIETPVPYEPIPQNKDRFFYDAKAVNLTEAIATQVRSRSGGFEQARKRWLHGLCPTHPNISPQPANTSRPAVKRVVVEGCCLLLITDPSDSPPTDLTVVGYSGIVPGSRGVRP
jgi:hypothetical protein